MKKSASRARGSWFEVVVDRVVVEEPAAVEQQIVEMEVTDEITIIAVVAAEPKMVLKDCYVPLVWVYF